jgi:hypothetical protein
MIWKSLRAAREDSGEYREIDRQLTDLIKSNDQAGLIAEEYQCCCSPSTRATARCP